MDQHLFDAFEEFLFAQVRMKYATRVLLRQGLKEADLDLTVEMMATLVELERHRGCSQTDLADLLVRDRASTTALLDNLAQRQLIERRSHDTDRRTKLIFLTALGEQRLVQVKAIFERVYRTASQGLDPHELQAAATLSARIKANCQGSA